MVKILFAVIAVATVAGCRSDVSIENSDGPDRYERQSAWEWCTGKHYTDYREVPVETRIACTNAIYGR